MPSMLLQPFICGYWSNAWIHITNHGVQRTHPSYSRERNTLLLPQLHERLAGSTFPLSHFTQCIHDVVHAVFASMKVINGSVVSYLRVVSNM
jgi:hypothetical protein